MEVRIVEVPPGDAPKHIRRAWVGLVLPLAAGETGAREEAPAAGALGRLRQRLAGRQARYVVPAEAALAILARAAPEAAAWLLTAAPELAGPGERPLSDVLAVQLVRCTGGSETYGRMNVGGMSHDPPTYQMNLVLDDERQQRLCLSEDTNWGATRADGAELASFLGVPLL